MSDYPAKRKSLIIQSEQELLRLGEALGKRALREDLFFLSGPLGVGKTTLTKGIAAGLGVTVPVTSPTFLLHKIYPGRLILNHLDLYRLHQAEDLELLELDELLTEGVSVVEWGEILQPQLDRDYLELVLEYAPAAEQRRLTLIPHGPRSLKLLEELS